MSFSDLMITDSPILSGLIWFVIITVVFYLARNHAHKAIIAVSRVLHNAMRVSAQSVMQAEKRLMQRNTEVLLEQGREATERIIEREFNTGPITGPTQVTGIRNRMSQVSSDSGQPSNRYRAM